jgi:Uncharacterized protein conserved in bacteria (DUF2252)
MHARSTETIQEATAAYETWLAEHTRLVPADLADKHTQMAADRFAFFRATYYRWAQRWSALPPELAKAPAVLAVGDLHIENFGTWRDSEGRLVWGINDFDEAFTLPYTNDLVRLATSALLAIEGDHLALRPRPACAALLDGYRAAMEAGGRPFVLTEEHPWLRRVATRRLRDAGRFWKRLDHPEVLTPSPEPPPEARMALDLALPERDLPYRVHTRVAGEGSLGHQRWVAISSWRGARIAREAKARAPSAALWAATDSAPEPEDPYAAIVGRAVRALDPFLRVGDRWLVRRLAPDCSRVELGSLAARRDEAALLEAMGWETANIHLGTLETTPAIVADLQKRSGDWLVQASRVMLRAVAQDWKAYRLS